MAITLGTQWTFSGGTTTNPQVPLTGIQNGETVLVTMTKDDDVIDTKDFDYIKNVHPIRESAFTAASFGIYKGTYFDTDSVSLREVTIHSVDELDPAHGGTGYYVQSFVLSPDGLILTTYGTDYSGTTRDWMDSWDLSTAFDISTATLTGNGIQYYAPKMTYSPNGAYLYTRTHRFSLSTPFDINSASVTTGWYPGTEDYDGLCFSPNGMIAYGINSGRINQINLSVAGYIHSGLSVGTTVYYEHFAGSGLTSYDTGGRGSAISSDGTHILICGRTSSGENFIFEYELDTPFQISTMHPEPTGGACLSKDGNGQYYSPGSFQLLDNGTKAYLSVSSGSDDLGYIIQYTVGAVPLVEFTFDSEEYNVVATLIDGVDWDEGFHVSTLKSGTGQNVIGEGVTTLYDNALGIGFIGSDGAELPFSQTGGPDGSAYSVSLEANGGSGSATHILRGEFFPTASTNTVGISGLLNSSNDWGAYGFALYPYVAPDTSVYGDATLASITPNLVAIAEITSGAFGTANLITTSNLDSAVYMDKFVSAALFTESFLEEFSRHDGIRVTKWQTETSYCDEDLAVKTGDDNSPETVVLDGVNTQNRRIRFLIQNGSVNNISNVRPYLQYRYENESVWNHIGKNSYHADNTAGVKSYPDLGDLPLELDDYHSLRYGLSSITYSDQQGYNFVEVSGKNEPIFLYGNITGSTPDYKTQMCRYNYTLKRFDIVNTVDFNYVANDIHVQYLLPLANKKPDSYAYYTALDEVNSEYGCKKSLDGYTWISADSDTPPPTGSTGFSIAAFDGTLYRFTKEGTGPYYIYVETWIGGVWANKREVDSNNAILYFVVNYGLADVYFPHRDIAIADDAVTLYYRDSNNKYYTCVIRLNSITELRNTGSATRFYADTRRKVLYEYIVSIGNSVQAKRYSVDSDNWEYVTLEPYEYEGKYFQYETIKSSYGSLYTVPDRQLIYFGLGKQIKYGTGDDEFHEINSKEIYSYYSKTYSWTSKGFSSLIGQNIGFSAVIEPTTDEVHLCGYFLSTAEGNHMLWSHKLPYKFLDRSHTTQQIGTSANYADTNNAFLAWAAPDMNDVDDVLADIPAHHEVEVVTEVVFDPEGFDTEDKNLGTIYFRLMDENGNLYLVDGEEARINVINPIERFAEATLNCTSILDDAMKANLVSETFMIADGTKETLANVHIHAVSTFESHCLQDTFQVMRYMFQDADGPESGTNLYPTNNLHHEIKSTDTFTDYIYAGTKGYANFFRIRIQVRNDSLISKTFNPIIQVRRNEEAWEDLSLSYTPDKPALSGYEGKRDISAVQESFILTGGFGYPTSGKWYDGVDTIHIVTDYGTSNSYFLHYATYVISTRTYTDISSYNAGVNIGRNYFIIQDSNGDIFINDRNVTYAHFYHYDVSLDIWTDISPETTNMMASGFTLDGSNNVWLVSSHSNGYDSTIKLYKWNGSSLDSPIVSTINRAVAWCFYDVNDGVFRMMTTYSDATFKEVTYHIANDVWAGPSGSGTGFTAYQYTGFNTSVEDLEVPGRFHLMTSHQYSFYLYWTYDPVNGYESDNIGYYMDTTTNFCGHYIHPITKALYAHDYETFYKAVPTDVPYNSYEGRLATDFVSFNMGYAFPSKEINDAVIYYGANKLTGSVIARIFNDSISGSSSNFDGVDVTQQLDIGTYVSANGAFFNNHNFLEDPIIIPVGSEVELVVCLSLNKSEMDLYTDHPVFQIRLHDASEPVEHREYYPTIRYLAPLNQTVDATLNCTSSLTAIAESGGTDEIFGIATLVCTSDLSAIVTLGGDVFGYGLLECFGYVDDAIVSMWPGGVIHIQSHSVLTANATENFEAVSHLQNTSNLNGVPFLEMLNALNINSISNLQAESHNDKNTTSNLANISAMSAVPTFAHNGKLPIIVSSGSLQADGVRDRYASSRLQNYCDLRAFGLNEVLCLAEMDAEANTSFSSSVDKPGAISLLSDSACFALGDITTFGLAGLISVSEVTAIPALDILAPPVLFDCRSDLFGSFVFNDNRDIIEFSSNIDRVVEFTLYDNDTNFVQEITMSYALDMYIAQVDLYTAQINQYKDQLLEITRVQTFGLDSVELEPQLFTGDIVRKIEYDLSIDRTVLHESEIQTTIAYNMQIEKISDKVIPLGL